MTHISESRASTAGWPEDPVHEPTNLFQGQIEDWPTVQAIENLELTDWGHHLSGQLMDFSEVTMSLVSVKPGQHHPAHYHVEGPHIALFLRGEGVMRLADREFDVKPGHVVIVPPGTIHYTRNGGSEQLEYIQFTVPSRPASNA